MEWSTAYAIGAGGVSSVLTYFRGRNKGVRVLERELHESRKGHEECRDKLSAFETEMVVLRKLMPGGEWFVKLGLAVDPNPPNVNKDGTL